MKVIHKIAVIVVLMVLLNGTKQQRLDADSSGGVRIEEDEYHKRQNHQYDVAEKQTQRELEQ